MAQNKNLHKNPIFKSAQNHFYFEPSADSKEVWSETKNDFWTRSKKKEKKSQIKQKQRRQPMKFKTYHRRLVFGFSLKLEHAKAGIADANRRTGVNFREQPRFGRAASTENMTTEWEKLATTSESQDLKISTKTAIGYEPMATMMTTCEESEFCVAQTACRGKAVVNPNRRVLGFSWILVTAIQARQANKSRKIKTGRKRHSW
jgi:hypothetical protein